MNGSYAFVLHLLGFGAVCAIQIVHWFIEINFRKEKDWNRKLSLLGFGGLFIILSPITVGVLFVTGIANIYNRYYSSPESWTAESWLVSKILLVAVLVLAGNFLGPALGKARALAVKRIIEEKGEENGESTLGPYNRRIAAYLAVQSILLILILILSVFGGGKHPGMF